MKGRAKTVLFFAVLFCLVSLQTIKTKESVPIINVLEEYEEPEALPSISIPEESIVEPVVEEPVIEESVTKEPEVSRGTASVQVEDFYYYDTFVYNGATYRPGVLTYEEQLFIYTMCQTYGIEFEAVMGLMGVETGWNLYVGQLNGYVGIGMVSVVNHHENFKALGLDINDPFDEAEYTCMLLGEKYLHYGTYSKALVVYNKGPGGATGINESKYSKKVLGFRDAMIESRQ